MNFIERHTYYWYNSNIKSVKGDSKNEIKKSYAGSKDTSFMINATYRTDIMADYSEIDAVAYRSDLDIGERTNGFGSAKLSMGTFQNEEFGSCTVYHIKMPKSLLY